MKEREYVIKLCKDGETPIPQYKVFEYRKEEGYTERHFGITGTFTDCHFWIKMQSSKNIRMEN